MIHVPVLRISATCRLRHQPNTAFGVYPVLALVSVRVLLCVVTCWRVLKCGVECVFELHFGVCSSVFFFLHALNSYGHRTLSC